VKNKKAILIKNALGLIIAAIGLILIMGGAYYKIYKPFMINQEIENAKNTIDLIMAKINALEPEQNNSYPFQFLKGDWVLTSWSKSEPADSKPDKCFLNSCLCICKDPGIINSDRSRLKNICQNDGICRKIEENNIQTQTWLAWPLYIEKINMVSDKYSSKPGALFLLYIEKNEDSIKIVRFTKDYLEGPKNVEEVKESLK